MSKIIKNDNTWGYAVFNCKNQKGHQSLLGHRVYSIEEAIELYYLYAPLYTVDLVSGAEIIACNH